jgi:hypothetical protein
VEEQNDLDMVGELKKSPQMVGQSPRTHVVADTLEPSEALASGEVGKDVEKIEDTKLRTAVAKVVISGLEFQEAP